MSKNLDKAEKDFANALLNLVSARAHQLDGSSSSRAGFLATVGNMLQMALSISSGPSQSDEDYNKLVENVCVMIAEGAMKQRKESLVRFRKMGWI